MEGEVCLLEVADVLDVPEVMEVMKMLEGDALYATLYAGDCGG